MKNNKHYNSNDNFYFKEETKDVKKMKQDTVFHAKPYKLHKKYLNKRNLCNQDAHTQFFNSNIPNKNITENPVSYVREKFLKTELNKLKNKIYVPEIFLDLHGFNQYQAKKELGKLIFICNKEKIFCFAVIHGHGKNILKNYLPIWLSKHPDVLAFYQLPKKCGRNTTLFVLIDYKKDNK
ncbi:endonuclease SmrB [Buchnera aphidicola]|nr:endonuclease SmrB [Buchnera aphidicola]